MDPLGNLSNILFYQTRKQLPVIKNADGIKIWDHDGKTYIDGCSGAVVCNIGYGNSRIEDAIVRQARSSFFAYRMHFENEPALTLAGELVSCSAPHLNRVFYVSSGSEAVESAMKLCRQYFYNRGEGSRHLFISRVPSYHGSTLGALSLTAYAPLEIPFRPLIKSYPKIPAPYCYRCAYHQTYPECNLACAWALEKMIQDQGPENVAAFVAEPIGGASTGALVPPEDYFAVIQQICNKYGIFLILDEVMTGFGRTGKLFAYEHWDIKADIVALSKGMASGYFPLGAILTRADVVEDVIGKGSFAHGHTYAGNPMACAVGLEVLHVITEDHLVENAAKVGKVLELGLQDLSTRHETIGQVRGRGLLLAMELVMDRKTRTPFPPEMQANQILANEAFDNGLIIYPRRSINGLTGDHVMVAPPLIATENDVQKILQKLDQALYKTESKLRAKLS